MTLSPVRLIETRRFADERGWFAETFSEPDLAARGITARFVQDNHSFSAPRFTLRGLHFQLPPHQQDKLIRCIRGRIFDVAVDIRRGSPTYGRWTGHELSDDNDRQLFIPAGFAHGFLTLEPGCEILYKASQIYAPLAEGGLAWSDPDIAVDWPLPTGAVPELSARDRQLPALADFVSLFDYDGRPLVPLQSGAACVSS